MSQEAVNDKVASIQSDLTAAQAANLPASAPVSFDPIVEALEAAADAIDALSGDSSALRTKIALIQNQSIDLSAIKTASDNHLSAQATIVDLLITQSNFDGGGETE